MIEFHQYAAGEARPPCDRVFTRRRTHPLADSVDTSLKSTEVNWLTIGADEFSNQCMRHSIVI